MEGLIPDEAAVGDELLKRPGPVRCPGEDLVHRPGPLAKWPYEFDLDLANLPKPEIVGQWAAVAVAAE